MHDLIRGLVLESVKRPEMSRVYYTVLSSRIMEVSKGVSEIQERFKWLHGPFLDLISQEAEKCVK